MKRAFLGGLMVLALLASTGCGVMQLALAQVTPPPPAATPDTSPLDAPIIQTADSASSTASRLGALGDLETALMQVYAAVNPAVVSIQIVQKAEAQPEIPSLPGWPQLETPENDYEYSGGSGFVWDTEGHIVTNNHVIEGADTITVRFSDGTQVPARLVGADPDSDLAVIQVDMPADRLTPARLADETVKVGQVAIAIGSPFGLENTMTVGFVSAIGRSLPVDSSATGGYTIPDIIQTDASINPGNSGGVLVNDAAEIIGVTTAIVSPVRASSGVGFAIPAHIVERVASSLISSGRYEHAWLGISGATLSPQAAEAMDLDADQRGALVITVVADGPAEKAGLRGATREFSADGITYRVGGDVIIAADDTTVASFDDLVAFLTQAEVGQEITLTVLREGKPREIQVVLAARQ